MERPQVVRHRAGPRLPPGFRFHPTDEELVVQYLKRKVFSLPLPAAVISEIDLEKHDPWDLPDGDDEVEEEEEEDEEERYFFHMRESKCAKKGSRSARPTSSGYWKATGKDRPVVASRSNRTVGTKRAFTFYLGKPRRGSRTDWFMQEYSLSADEIRGFSVYQKKNTPHISACMFEIKDWVVCRIFKKNRREMKHGSSDELAAGFVARQNNNRRSCSPLSPSSSCVTTDLSDNGSGEENSSYKITSSPRED